MIDLNLGTRLLSFLFIVETLIIVRNRAALILSLIRTTSRIKEKIERMNALSRRDL